MSLISSVHAEGLSIPEIVRVSCAGPIDRLVKSAARSTFCCSTTLDLDSVSFAASIETAVDTGLDLLVIDMKNLEYSETPIKTLMVLLLEKIREKLERKYSPRHAALAFAATKIKVSQYAFKYLSKKTETLSAIEIDLDNVCAILQTLKAVFRGVYTPCQVFLHFLKEVESENKIISHHLADINRSLNSSQPLVEERKQSILQKVTHLIREVCSSEAEILSASTRLAEQQNLLFQTVKDLFKRSREDLLAPHDRSWIAEASYSKENLSALSKIRAKISDEDFLRDVAIDLQGIFRSSLLFERSVSGSCHKLKALIEEHKRKIAALVGPGFSSSDHLVSDAGGTVRVLVKEGSEVHKLFMKYEAAATFVSDTLTECRMFCEKLILASNRAEKEECSGALAEELLALVSAPSSVTSSVEAVGEEEYLSPPFILVS